MITYKQLSLADIFTNCQNKFDNDKYEFLSILEHNLNLDEIVPASFTSYFHASTGRPRKYFFISYAQGSVSTTYILNSYHISSDCILKILSRITRFLRF